MLAAGASATLRRRSRSGAARIALLRARPLLAITGTPLISAGPLLTITRALLLAVTRLLTAGAEITVLVTVTLVVVTILVALLVVVFPIPHDGCVSDDARTETDGEDCRGGSCNGGALAPRGFLRCRLPCRGASSHSLVARRLGGRSLRDRLQGRVCERASPLLLGDRWHLRRFRLRFMGGQHLGLLRNLRL